MRQTGPHWWIWGDPFWLILTTVGLNRSIRNFHLACGRWSGNRHSFRFSIQQALDLHLLKALVFHADQSLQWGSGQSTTSASIFCPAFQFSRELFTLVQLLNLSRKGPRPEPWNLDSLCIRNIKLQRLWECYFGCLVMIEQMGIIREEFMNWTGHSSSPEDTGLRTLICECDGEWDGVCRIRSQPLPWGTRERE